MLHPSELAAFEQRLRASIGVDPARWPQHTKPLPDLSVVIPTFRQAHFLERTLRSIASQGVDDVEVIVVDGGNDAETPRVIQHFSGLVSTYVREPDHGQSDALNKGFARATGRIFAWMNADDLYYPGAFRAALEAFEQFRDKRVVYGDWLSIDGDDRVTRFDFALDFCTRQLATEGFVSNAQAMFWRREVHERFGEFDRSLQRTMDYEMMLRFGINEGDEAFLRVGAVLACFRRHAEQKTQGYDDVVDREQRQIAAKWSTGRFGPVGGLRRRLYRLRRFDQLRRRAGISIATRSALSSLLARIAAR